MRREKREGRREKDLKIELERGETELIKGNTRKWALARFHVFSRVLVGCAVFPPLIQNFGTRRQIVSEPTAATRAFKAKKNHINPMDDVNIGTGFEYDPPSFLAVSEEKLEEEVKTLISKVDNAHVLEATALGLEFGWTVLNNEALQLNAYPARKVQDFVQGYLARVASEFGNTRYANRAFLAVVALLVLLDNGTDLYSIYSLFFVQEDGFWTGVRLIGSLIVHKLLEVLFVVFVVCTLLFTSARSGLCSCTE